MKKVKMSFLKFSVTTVILLFGVLILPYQPSNAALLTQFSDDFNGTKSASWGILNRDDASWTLGASTGSLSLTTTGTDYLGMESYSNSVKNLFYIPLPSSSVYQVTAKLSFPVLPTQLYQTGGIGLFCNNGGIPDLDNMVTTEYGVYDTGIDYFMSWNEDNGVFNQYTPGSSLNYSTNTPYWLRISRNGTTYNTYYSTDGSVYNLITTITSTKNFAYTGIYAIDGAYSSPHIRFDFDSFEIQVPQPEAPLITGTTTNEDTQSSSGLVITRNALNGAEVTHFKITSITGGTLYKNDGTTVISNNDYITAVEGGAGLKFTPAANMNTPAGGIFGFTAQAALDNTGTGLSTGTSAAITVNSVVDAPAVTAATTSEDTQSTAGLVITRNLADGAEVTHFKITGITGGTLYKNDGTTVINNNNYITAAEGGAGLKFTPAANVNTPAGDTVGFTVQAALDNTGTGISTGTSATITVTEVNDAPTGAADALSSILENSGARTIAFAALLANDQKGPANESGQTLSITGVSSPIGGTATISGTDVIFTPTADYTGAAGFTYTIEDNGTTNGAADPKTGTGTVSFTISPSAKTPSITSTTTNEDTQSSSGLVITRNALNGAEVTHFKITSITGGTLYKNDGTTVISNNDYITAAEGGAGLKFTPSANMNTPAGGTFGFTVQAALDNTGTGISTGTSVSITVNSVADIPSVTAATMAEDTQSTAGLVITRNLADGAEVTHFKISSITGGTLYKNDGTTVINNNNYITAAEGGAGLKFTPSANVNTPAGGTFGFTVQAALDNTGTGISTGTSAAITVTEVNDTPTGAADTLSSILENSGARTIAFAALLANDQKGPANESGQTLSITGVSSPIGGTASISGTDVIFTPTADYTGAAGFTYTIEDNGTTNGVADPKTGTGTVSFTISPSAKTPTITNTTTNEDTQSSSGLVITRNALNGAEVTHFKITSITGGTLYKNDGTTVISNNDYITAAEGGAGLKFTPAANMNTPAGGTFGFTAQAALDNTGTGISTGATVSITVNPVADIPSVTASTMAEDTQSTGGLVITRNLADGAEVTHFKITGITGGTLYKNDGTTAIGNNDYITAAEGGAGLKFTPAANMNTPAGGTFGFTVQAASDDTGTGISTGTSAAITVTEVNDAPTGSADTLSSILENSGARTIAFAALLANDQKGPANESGQTLSITGVSSPIGGTASISGTDVIFTPTASYTGVAGFSYTIEDNGTTNGAADPKTGTGTVSFTISPSAKTPSITNTTTNEDIQSSSGLVITRNALNGAEVTHFKISSITGGTLYKNDGTTVISNNDYITAAEGGAGLKFTPSANMNTPAGGTFGFTAQAALDNTGTGISIGATVSITVNSVADIPSVTAATMAEDTQSTGGLVITRNLADGAEVTHFKISSITGGTLYKNDGTTAIGNNDYITAAEGGAGLKFTPSANVNTPAGDIFGFTVQAASDDTGTGIGAGTSAAITVTEVNDTPTGTADTLSSILENSGARTIAFAALLANDQKGPANESGQTLSITGVSSPMGGTASISGTDVIFTPTADYTGAAGFTYTIEDNGTTNGAADPKTGTGTVSFNVTRQSSSNPSGSIDSPNDVIISCTVNQAEELVTLSDDGAAKLEIPSGAITDDGEDPVEVTVNKLSKDDVNKLLKNAEIPEGFTALTMAFEFNAEVIRGGSATKITTFKKPVVFSIKLQESELAKVNDPEKIGFFKVNDDGTLTFIGGRIANGMFVVEMSGFSRYVLSEVNITFKDIKGHWGQKDIELMASKFIVSGDKNGNFAPDRKITRAEFISMLVSSMRLTGTQDPVKFKDVSDTAWYYKAVKAAANNGITSGYPDGTFRPNDYITREQVAVMLSKVLKKFYKASALPNDKVQSILTSLVDREIISDWARNDVALAIELGLIYGKSVKNIAPADITTRAEAAVMISKLWKRI